MSSDFGILSMPRRTSEGSKLSILTEVLSPLSSSPKSESTYCTAIYIRLFDRIQENIRMMRPAHRKSGDFCLTIDFIAAETRALWPVKSICCMVKISLLSELLAD